MTILLSAERVDALAAAYRRYLLVGIAGILLSSSLGGVGIITAAMAAWLGALAGSFQAWRTERGLWMLSGLFMVITLALYVPLQLDSLMDLFRGRRTPAWLALDVSLGTALLFIQLRFLLTVTVRNRHLPARDLRE